MENEAMNVLDIVRQHTDEPMNTVLDKVDARCRSACKIGISAIVVCEHVAKAIYEKKKGDHAQRLQQQARSDTHES